MLYDPETELSQGYRVVPASFDVRDFIPGGYVGSAIGKAVPDVITKKTEEALSPVRKYVTEIAPIAGIWLLLAALFLIGMVGLIFGSGGGVVKEVVRARVK